VALRIKTRVKIQGQPRRNKGTQTQKNFAEQQNTFKGATGQCYATDVVSESLANEDETFW
jgi:hypothetical protein